MGSTLIGSGAVVKKNRVYHKDGCMYAKRIKYDHVIRISLEQAINKNVCLCKYCSGLKGDIRIQKKSLEKRTRKNGMGFHYDQNIPLHIAMHGEFHRQGDIKPTDVLNNLLDYISAHGTSKVIIADDYRKLPQKTKRKNTIDVLSVRRSVNRQPGWI